MIVRISDDALARALGADKLAEAFAKKGHEVQRTSSWGMHWLEPLVEIEIDGTRTGYGPVAPSDIAAILDGTADAIRIGDVATLPFFARQQRFTFARCGITDPLSLDDYGAHGGWKGLDAARAIASRIVATANGYSERI